MASAERHPLDRLPSALEWHEAVAVVQEIATRALAGEAGIARRAADVAFDAEGQLILPNTGHAVAVFGALKSARGAQDLADLRMLLHDLLPKTTLPPALGVLADPANANAGVTSVAEFSKALSFFERPNRARDLKVIAARLAAVNEQATLHQRLADLTRKARAEDRHEASHPVTFAEPQPTSSDVPQTADTGTPRVSETAALGPSADASPVLPPGSDFFSEEELIKPKIAPRSPDRKIAEEIGKRLENWLPAVKTTALVAGILVLLTVAAIGGYALVTRTSPEITQAVATESTPKGANPTSNLAVEKTTGTSARSKQHASSGSSVSPVTPRKSPSVESEIAHRAVPDVRAAAGPAHADPAPAAEVPGSSTPAAMAAPTLTPLLGDSSRLAGLRGQPLFLGSGLLDASVPLWDGVYDSRHSQVRPAKLLRPQLPEIPPNTSIETLGMFEFVVSMRGTVERIRLVRSPADRQYRDIMLMPAAKAWIFQPAHRDGVPVRYRLQIPIPQ